MDVKECILERRSIRKFKEQPVSREVIEELVSLAEYAPTWKNVQANRVIAVTDPVIKQKVADECTSYSGNQRIITGAPVLLVMTIVDKRSGFERDGSFSTTKGTHWQSFDSGLFAQTLCLSANALGLGTVIMGIYDEDKVREVVSVPEGESVAALIALGYPDEKPDAPKRKELEKILSYR